MVKPTGVSVEVLYYFNNTVRAHDPETFIIIVNTNTMELYIAKGGMMVSFQDPREDTLHAAAIFNVAMAGTHNGFLHDAIKAEDCIGRLAAAIAAVPQLVCMVGRSDGEYIGFFGAGSTNNCEDKAMLTFCRALLCAIGSNAGASPK